jgi:hypothetical protein
MRYVKVTDGLVVNATEFNGQMPDDWGDKPGWVQSDAAQIGWAYDGSVFTPPAPPAPHPPTPEQLRKAVLSAEADFIDLLNRASTASPAQINSWLTSNVTTLAQARTVIGAIIKIIAVRLT